MTKSLMAGFIAVFIIALAGCKTQKTMITLSGLEGEWDLVELNGSPVTSGQYKQFIKFDIVEKRFSGSAGCNRMSGGLEYNQSTPDKIQFSKAMTTRMACPILESEQKFLSALESVNRFEAVPAKGPADQVALYNADNAKVIIIRKR